MSYFRILVSVIIFCFSLSLCYAQDNFYPKTGNSKSSHPVATVISYEYEANGRYRGVMYYNTELGIANYYDAHKGYTSYSIVDNNTGIINNYDTSLGYTGYSQVYLER